MKPSLSLIVLSAALAAHGVSAQTIQLGDVKAEEGAAVTQAPIQLGDVVVSGGLTPVEAARYGRASSVVTAADIERRQFTEVSEVLRALPGVSITRSGGPGGVTSVRIRGSENSNVLVLIDGVEAAPAQNGFYDFSSLLAADIARVEVLRGAQSAIYGANAAAGVISIYTKGGVRNGFAAGADLEAGTNETGSVLAFVRGGSENIDASFSVAARREGGYDISDDAGGKDDRDENLTINMRANADIARDVRVGGAVRYVTRDSDADAFNFGAANRAGLVTESDDGIETQELFLSAHAEFDGFGGMLRHGPSANYSDVDSQNRTAGAQSTDTSSTRLHLDYKGTIALDGRPLDAAEHSLTLLAEFEKETFKNLDPTLVFDPTQLNPQSRNLFGFAGEYRGTFFDRLDLQVGVRHDFNDDFDDATTFAAGASYRLPDTGTRFHGSIGRGVTNPTFFEQFGFIPGSFVPNAAIQPEENFTWDIGVEQRLLDDRLILDVTYFNETLNDEIVTVFNPDFTSTVQNATGDSDRQGVEVGLTAEPVDGLLIGATYTWLDADDALGAQEVRRPKHEGSAEVSYNFYNGRATLGGNMRFALDNLDTDFTAASFGAGTVDLGDYAVFGIFGSFAVSNNAEIFGRVENLTDEDYFEIDGYATRGLTGFGGVRLRW